MWVRYPDITLLGKGVAGVDDKVDDLSVPSCPVLSSPVHSGPNRIPRKEDMLALPGYVDLEVKLFATMREEIQ